MDWISSLERRFGSWAIPRLYLYLIGVQVIGFIYLLSSGMDGSRLMLSGAEVLRGDWWRLVSFMMLPEAVNPLWFFLSCYVFFLIGAALEQQWGVFRFNLFILIGYLLTVAAAFIAPRYYITNFYFLGSIFLAFATLFPNFEFLLFFILPVKVKWLGWMTAAMYVLGLFSSGLGDRLCIAAAFINYGIFFGPGLVRVANAAKRRQTFVAKTTVPEQQSRHRCAECGITEKDDPSVHFRYCSTCGKCFCADHMEQHRHE